MFASVAGKKLPDGTTSELDPPRVGQGPAIALFFHTAPGTTQASVSWMVAL
jgi:hypothetical protein